MNEVLEIIGQAGIIPVVKIQNPEDAVPLGRALIEGGLPVAEITFRTNAAEESIRILTEKMPGLLVGAGTVLSIEQAKKAVQAGARFIVSPGFNPHVVDYCIENEILITPGINSPTQLEMALERGLNVVKFFPAEASGGIPLLKAMAAPYTGLKFIPTGGINENNLSRYLDVSCVHACGGSWMVTTDFISSGRFDEITKLTKEAVSIVLGFEIIHLGIYEENNEKAVKSNGILSDLFRFPVISGTGIEVMHKSSFTGNKGYIAIATHNIYRALFYLKKRGVSIEEEAAEEKDGKLKAIHIKNDVSGFALKIIQKYR